jgi:hypothetical protein
MGFSGARPFQSAWHLFDSDWKQPYNSGAMEEDEVLNHHYLKPMNQRRKTLWTMQRFSSNESSAIWLIPKSWDYERASSSVHA